MYGYPSWGDATLGERLLMVAGHIFLWGVVLPAMLIGALFLFGMMADGVTERATELSRCQKHAPTPYEYHKCR